MFDVIKLSTVLINMICGVEFHIPYYILLQQGMVQYKYVNRSLGYWRTGGLNLKQFSISFQQEVLSVRELVRLENLFSGTGMDGWWRGLFQQAGGIGNMT